MGSKAWYQWCQIQDFVELFFDVDGDSLPSMWNPPTCFAVSAKRNYLFIFQYYFNQQLILIRISSIKVRKDRFPPEGDIRHLVPFTDEELKPLRSANNWTLGQLFSGFLDYFASKFK
jgi:hypothetical protein